MGILGSVVIVLSQTLLIVYGYKITQIILKLQILQ